MAKHLIFGGYGMIGSALYDELVSNKQEVTKVFFNYRIENKQQVWQAVEWVEPDFIWLCAAYTNVTKCETDSLAAIVNIHGVRNVAWAAQRVGAKLVFFSSSYVFSGDNEKPYTPEDTPWPISTYGLHKHIGEGLVELVDDYIIVRTCAVYGRDVSRRCFPYYVLDTLQTGGEVIAAADQIVRPIHVKELARLSVHAGLSNVKGMLHMNGNEDMSKFEWANIIAKVFELPARIRATCDDPIRPKNGTLRNSFYTKSFSSGMREFMNDYKAANS